MIEVGDCSCTHLQGSVQRHSEALIYHTLDWQNVIQETYGYTPHYIVAGDENRVRGLLPLFAVNSLLTGRHLSAIPFSHHVPVLYESKDVLRGLVERARKLAIQKGYRYIEIRGSAKALAELGFEASSHNWITVLNLEVGEQSLWDNLRSSVRRNVRKARRNHLVIRRGKHPADFDSFYRLVLETRRYQGVPPYPKRLFGILQTMPQARLHLALQEDDILAGIITLCYGKHVIYAYGASTKNREKLGLRPNDLLFWHVISEAYEEGFREFDFGTTPKGLPGLLRFKENWGGRSEEIAYSYWLNTAKRIPIVDRDSKVMRWASHVIRKMPVFAVQLVGEVLFRQLG
jgi:hypothetical protein